MKLHLFSIFCLTCCLVGGSSLAAAPDIGPKIGDQAPDFTLPDQNGKEVTLSKLLENGPVAIVFYRSASW